MSLFYPIIACSPEDFAEAYSEPLDLRELDDSMRAAIDDLLREQDK